MTLIYFILVLGITILIHEFGHYLFAKKAGVSESTIRKQISKGQYSGAKKVDGKWMIPYGNKAKFVGERNV